VPVLSKTTVSTRAAVWSAAALLTSIPRAAAIPTPTTTAVGVARPSAQGQATTSTETATVRANPSPRPAPIQTANETRATRRTAGTKYAATESASSCTGARDACASRTSATTCARKVSLPVLVASKVNEPGPLIVPPVTSSPGRLGTGIGSPVTIDSSIHDSPSFTRPSTGTFSPGLTTTTSPGTTSSTGTAVSPPAVRTTAVRDSRPTRRRRADEVLPLAAASSQRPRRMNAMSIPAVS